MGETLNTNTYNDPINPRHVFLKAGDTPIDFRKIEKKSITTQDGVELDENEKKRRGLQFILEEGYQEEYKKRIKTPYQKAFIEGRINTLLDYVGEKIKSYDQIGTVSFQHGVLTITGKSGDTIFQENAITLWDNTLKGTGEMKKVSEEARKKSEALREEAMTESLFGGNIVVKYALIGGGAILATDSLLHATAGVINGQARLWNGYQRISEIMFRTPSGTFERVSLSGDAILQKYIEGSRDMLRSQTLSVLEKLGYAFDPVKKTVTNIAEQAFIALRDVFIRMSPVEIKKAYNVEISEGELIKVRKSLGDMASWGKNIPSISSRMMHIGLHAVMWPVFFANFTKRQNSANFVAGLGEWGLFTIGVKAGEKIGKIGGTAGKFLAPLVLGGITAMGGHGIYEKAGGSQAKWETFNGTDMYNYRRSALLQLINLGAPETIDQINKYTLDSLNAAIPKGDFTQWLGKSARNIPLTGGTGITPEVAFIQSRVHLGVDPIVWMGGSLNNRNKDSWNKEVSRYIPELKRNIFLLIEQYQKKLPPFFPDDTQEKSLQLFEDILKIHVLRCSENSFYKIEQCHICEVVIAEVKNWKKERSNQYIADVIDNYTASMYMSPLTFENLQTRLQGEKVSIEGKIGELAGKIQNPEEKKYFQSIFNRIERGERLFAPDKVDGNPFSDRASIELSQEHRLFLSILKNKNTISWPQGNKKTDMEMGEVFAGLLDLMADYAIRRDGIIRLSSIPGDENGAYWTENEWGKKILGIRQNPNKSVFDKN